MRQIRNLRRHYSYTLQHSISSVLTDGYVPNGANHVQPCTILHHGERSGEPLPAVKGYSVFKEEFYEGGIIPNIRRPYKKSSATSGRPLERVLIRQVDVYLAAMIRCSVPLAALATCNFVRVLSGRRR